MALCVLCLDLGCSLEAFHCSFHLIICEVKWGGVLTLTAVLRLLLCVYVFDLSLVILWVVPTHAS